MFTSSTLIKRRSFLKLAGSTLAISVVPLPLVSGQSDPQILTVHGPVSPESMGMTLTHEHILVDFIGADQVDPSRYNADQVFQKVLPYLEEVRKLGCKTFVECTPNFLGRDVRLLQRLAKASGLQILTNTGYYGARDGMFLPESVHHETPEQIARHWIQEYREGINDTNIRPGFIKIGVNNHPLPEYDRKIVAAAALTHLETGLTIAAHTGDAPAAFEEMEIIRQAGVHPSAFIWVHAQEKGTENHIRAAQQGAWVEIDGISMENYEEAAQQVKALQEAGLLSKVLVSCDAGWYHVGEPEGGQYRTHAVIFQQLVPTLKRLGFKEWEVEQLLVRNPAEVFTIRVRKA